jgi:hypothetical protein
MTSCEIKQNDANFLTVFSLRPSNLRPMGRYWFNMMNDLLDIRSKLREI